MKKFIVSLCSIFSALALSAQVNQYSGVVLDDAGIPLPGSAVVVKGTDKAMSTDFEGKFSIDATSADTLVVTFIGFQEYVLPLADLAVGGDLSIQLKPEEGEELEEVVVTAMGVKRSKKSLTSAQINLKGSDAVEAAEPDVLKSLQGKLAGVNIAGSSGLPGTATRITIRGSSSFTGNNQPLFVVDGVPYNNAQDNTGNQLTTGGAYASGIASLDPNSIADMQVLKGAAASALYGSRAANGVILITTKGGSSGSAAGTKKANVSIVSSVTMDQISGLPDYQNKYGTGNLFNYRPFNGSWGAPFSSLDSIPYRNAYQNAYPELYKDKKQPYVAHPDNVKNLFDTGVTYENSITVSGGNPDANMSITYSNLDQTGFIPGSTFDRNSINLGGNMLVYEGFVVGGSLSYSNSKQSGPQLGSGSSADAGAASSMARTLWLGRSWDMNLPYEEKDGSSLFFTNVDNPLWSWKNNRLLSDLERTVVSLNANYSFLEKFTTSLRVGYNTMNDRRQQVFAVGSQAYNGDGGLVDDDIARQELESTFTFTYTDRFMDDQVGVSFTAGQNLNQRMFESTTVRGLKATIKGIHRLTNYNEFEILFDSFTKRRLVGAFGNLQLDYQDYLFLNISGRNDWSSTLPKSKQSFFYPSVSSSFVFTDAIPGLKSDFLNSGKIRASWASVGNDAAPYSLQTVYTVNPSGQQTTYPLGSTAGMRRGTVLADPDLSPEFTNEIEVGIELEMLNRQILLDVALYDKRTTDQIGNVSLARSTGYSSLLTNFGEISNRGIEASLDFTIIPDLNGFKWNTFTAFTKNVNKVESLRTGLEEMTVRNLFGGGITPMLIPGENYGVFRGSRAARDEDGNFLIDPATGYIIEDTEQGIVGDPNPEFNLAITNSFSFKGFTLSALLDYKHGGDISSVTVSSLLGRGVTKDTEDRERANVIPGYYADPSTLKLYTDRDGKKIRNVTQISTNELYFVSGGGTTFALNGADEFSVYDGSVLRLRDVSVSYDFPKDLLSMVNFTSLRLSLSARNLWFYAPNIPEYTNFDPEINTFGATNTQGIDFGAVPSSTRYTFSVNLTF